MRISKETIENFRISYPLEKLAPLEGVTGCATHFILHKYKENHLIFDKREKQEKEWIFT